MASVSVHLDVPERDKRWEGFIWLEYQYSIAIQFVGILAIFSYVNFHGMSHTTSAHSVVIYRYYDQIPVFCLFYKLLEAI